MIQSNVNVHHGVRRILGVKHINGNQGNVAGGQKVSVNETQHLHQMIPSYRVQKKVNIFFNALFPKCQIFKTL